MSSLALGGAFAAVQLVYKAYSKAKTSKARCARLVERCQLVVDRLERIATARDGDMVIRERIHELERAFEYTAQTIFQVGQQSVITSLLRSENNALRVESCNEALTELISLFTLEESVDARRWQSDLDAARRRDHQELLSMGQRIESGNAAINHELAQQGATIAEVLRVLHDISAGLESAGEPLEIELPFVVLSEADSRPLSPSSSSAASDSRSTPAPNAPFSLYAASESAKSKTTLRRRLSFTKCVKIAPLANVFSKLSLSPSSRARSTRNALFCGRSPHRSRSSRLEPIFPAVAGDGVGAVASAATLGYPVDPPPPYQTHATNSGGVVAPISPPSRFATITSIEAVRAPDSPVPLFPSPKLSTESVFGSTQSLASLSETLSGPRRPRRSSMAGIPELKRKDTMRSGQRNAMTCTRAQPVHRST